MGRRIRWLGLIIVLCFVLVLLQLTNIQVWQGKTLADSPGNPRNATVPLYDQPRGRILAADGTPLAYSVKTPHATYQFQRVYPQKGLFADVVGYQSLFYGTAGIEDQYNQQLKAHKQPPQSFSQFLSGQTNVSTDDVTLTVRPALQQAATNALLSNPNANKDGAVVALDPRTGAVLALASNPTFDPNSLAAQDIKTEESAGRGYFNVKDAEGFLPGVPLATFNAFAPGSTFKVVTSSAVYNLVPNLINFTWPTNGPPAGCTSPGEIQQTPLLVCNDPTDINSPQSATPCGGTMAQMLPESCDPGYAVLGIHVGASALYQEATDFGFDAVPPIDLTDVSKSNFPTPAELAHDQPGLAYSAFGQKDVQATALQMAMVAAGVANNGNVMTPHVMAEVRNSQGALVQSNSSKVYKQAMSAGSAQQVNQLMQLVVSSPQGTANGIFDPVDQVAAKTGTAQTSFQGAPATNDWMIAFAPASNPTVAVAVVVPEEPVSAYGATVAGPIVKQVIEAALALQHSTPSAPLPPPAISTTTATPASTP